MRRIDRWPHPTIDSRIHVGWHWERSVLGLMYLAGATLYLAVIFLGVRWAWRRGRADGGSTIKGSIYALIAFLLIYLSVFWNWLPALTTYRRMCEGDAGFTESVTAADWIRAHRFELKSLDGIDPNHSTDARLTSSGYWRSLFFGGLLGTETRDEQSTQWGMRLWRQEMRVVDIADGRILAQAVNYSLGSSGDVRIWLTRATCFAGGANPIGQLSAYKMRIRNSLK